MFKSPALSSRSPAPLGLWLDARVLGSVLGVWISLYCFADLLLRPRTDTLIAAADISDLGQAPPALTAAFVVIIAMGLAPILLGAAVFGVDFRRAKLFFGAIFLLVLAVPLSLLPTNEFKALGYVVMTDYVFVCFLLMLAIKVDGEALMRAFLTAVGISVSVAMVAALVDHDFVWGRLIGRTAPNYWGGLAAIAILCSFVVRSALIRVAMVGLSLVVLYFAQPREVLLSTSVTVALTFGLLLRRPDAKRWAWPLLAMVLIGLSFVVVESKFVADKVFLLSDPERGLGSGFTGRSETWREGWAIFSAHPWLGVGYSQAGRYLTGRLGIHNAYLSTLAETGIFGLIGYLILFVGAFCRAILRAWRLPTETNVVQAALLTGFLVGSMMEPVGLHVGNTHTMLTIFVAARAWAWRPEAAEARLRLWTPRLTRAAA